MCTYAEQPRLKIPAELRPLNYDLIGSKNMGIANLTHKAGEFGASLELIDMSV